MYVQIEHFFRKCTFYIKVLSFVISVSVVTELVSRVQRIIPESREREDHIRNRRGVYTESIRIIS